MNSQKVLRLKVWIALALCGFYLVSFQIVSAQTVVTGELAGIVTDPTGAVVANAKLTLKNDATGEAKDATSSSAGEFRFALLRPGSYTLSVMSTGFGEFVQKTTISLGQTTNVTIQLTLQTQTQTVEVTEVPALIQADNANLATTYNNQLLENLPAPGMDMTAYAQTAPGVTVSTGGGYGNFSAFGLPAVSNLFTINGNDNMDPYLNLNNSGASNLTLGANEIQEAAVVLNGYTGQYGRQAGAQVNYVTKSGGNAFHGNAGWLWNGNDLNANDWFNNASGTPIPHAVSNQWFDSIGGPIKKDKAFFFFDNEGLRYVLPSGGPVYIPTTDFGNAVLANLGRTNPASVPMYQTALGLYNNASGASRARPLTTADDPALGCGDLVTLNGAGTAGVSSIAGPFGVSQPCARVFQDTTNSLNTEWLLAVKGDLNLSSTDRLYFRYNTDHGIQATSTDPINQAFSANSVQPQYGGQAGYTKSIGATMVNQLLLSASYYSAIFGPPDYANAVKTFPTAWEFFDAPFNGLAGSQTDPISSFPQGRKVRQWQLLDDFSKVWSKHTFKVGVNVRKNWVSTYATQPNQFGNISFNSTTDFYNGSLTNGSVFSQAFPQVGAQDLTLYSLGFYGQDEWKVRQNLTVTLALRLDRNSNIQCGANCFSEFQSPFTAISHNVTTPYNQVIHTGISEAFPGSEAIVAEPRVGLAYNVAKNTVLRGGFGIFSDLNQALVADRFLSNSPNVATFTTSAGLVALNNPNSIYAATANSNGAFQRGFASGATLAQLQASVPGFVVPNFDTVSSKMKSPKYQEWNVEVQHQITSRYLLSVNYVGNRGYDEITQSTFLNAFSSKNFAGLPATVPDARFGNIRELNNASWSNYNGMVTSLRWRMSNQFTGSFSYTWSHALDTCSNACLERFNLLPGAPSIRQQISPFGLGALNYSNADYDVRHSLNANYVYTVPTTYFHNSILKAALGNWTVAGTFLFHSGYPFSVQDSSVRTSQSIGNAAGLLTATFLADYLGTGYPSCGTPNVACMTTSMFAKAANQHDFGNIPRNSFRGPGYFDTDLNLTKTIPIHERYRFTIGAFFYNILNHPNFDNPYNNVAVGSTFGQILETVSPPSSPYGSFQGSAVSGRVIQTQVKFSF
jgi:hypothetical protein